MGFITKEQLGHDEYTPPYAAFVFTSRRDDSREAATRIVR
jgi:hypothetical protein